MPAVRMGATLDTLAVIGLDLPAPALAKLRGAFPTVHYYPKIHTDPEATIPAEVRGDIDMVFSQWKALPVDCPLADLPKLKHIQLSTAGVDMALRSSPAIRELAQPNPPDVTLSTASGAHVLSIPNYVVAMTINLYHQIQQMLRVARVSSNQPQKFATQLQKLTVTGEAVLEQDRSRPPWRTLLRTQHVWPYRWPAWLRCSGS